MSDKCPVCNSEIAKPEQHQYKKHFNKYYSCKRCGEFDVLGSFSPMLHATLGDDNKKIAVLSHWIRAKHEKISKSKPDEQFYREVIILDKKLVDNIIKRTPPSPAEQADNVIRWIGENIDAPGEIVKLEIDNHMSIMGAITPNNFALVIRHLIDSGIMQGNLSTSTANVTLSFEGWQYFEELKRGVNESRKAFMAMQYGDDKMDKIVEEVFKPAVKQTGFDLFKLVDRPKAGLIDDRLRVEIQTSRFLIADLTHENAGAYWEAGYAEGLGKPVIYTCENEKFEEQKTHFDTNHHLTIIWDEENPSEAAEELKATIRATLPEEAKLTDE